MKVYRTYTSGATEKAIPRRYDIATQKAALKRRKERLRTWIEREGGAGGVLFAFKGLSQALLAVLADIEPLNDLRTASEDRRRSEILDETVRVMNLHMRLQCLIVRSKKQ